MTFLCYKPGDMRFDAPTRAELMGLRSMLRVYRKGLRRISDPDLRVIVRKAIAVTVFDIRELEGAR